MTRYKVLKKFSSDRDHEPGEVVDLDGRNIEKLVSLRYIEAVATKAEPVTVLAPVESPKKTPTKERPKDGSADLTEPKRGRGRPKGAKTRAKAVTLPPTTPAPV